MDLNFGVMLSSPLYLSKVIQPINKRTGFKPSWEHIFFPHSSFMHSNASYFQTSTKTVTQHLESSEDMKAWFREESTLHARISTRVLENAATQHCSGTPSLPRTSLVWLGKQFNNHLGYLSFPYGVSFPPMPLSTALLQTRPWFS